VGAYHHTVLDLPMNDWLNQWPTYTGAYHREELFMDPYASKDEKKVMIGGWFVPHLPDLNLTNPYCAKFVIQSNIWSTEEFGIDGWRVDTYKYCDEKFLNEINHALMREYPKLTVFGEAWTNTVPASAYFTENNLDVPFKHKIKGVTDFPLNTALYNALNDNFGWTDGITRLYMTLSQDFLYKDPFTNCIFLDNHDMNRFYSMVGEDLSKYKMGLGLLMTLRGIPQLYYGTEVLMKNYKDPNDAAVRKDFPGGWKEDKESAFAPKSENQQAGRNQMQEEYFNFTKIIVKIEKKPRGTAGSLSLLGIRDNFILINGDTFFPINIKKFITLAQEKNIVTAAITKNYKYKSNKKLVGIKIHKNSIVKLNTSSKLMNGGTYVINKKIFTNISRKFQSLENIYKLPFLITYQ
jgi:glycosidase